MSPAKDVDLLERPKRGNPDRTTRSEVGSACARPSGTRSARKPVQQRLSTTAADPLDVPDASFDLMYSIDIIHNLDPNASERG